MNVVITGSTRGIGLGLAREFLKKGHSVMINGRNRERTTEVLIKLRMEFPDSIIHSYACNVTCYNSVDRMFWEANRFFGRVDIWINNAGMDQERELLINHSKENIDRVIDLNIKGVIYGTQVALRGMKDRGGYIYNMEGYGSNDMMTDKMSIYGTSKRALTYFTRSISREMRHSSVKVCLLSPGMVLTDFLLNSIPKLGKDRDRIIKAYNLLADSVEDVTSYLVKRILKKPGNGKSLKWLTTRKILCRLFLQIFRKRRVVP